MSSSSQLVIPPYIDPKTIDIDITAFDSTTTIDSSYPGGDICLDIEGLSQAALGQVSDISLDLIDIAFHVYSADKRIRRGTIVDVFADNWARNITIVVPVRRLDVWQSNNVSDALQFVLSFLTGDRWTFKFAHRNNAEYRPVLNFTGGNAYPNANAVCLFSGGMDSSAGAVLSLLHSDVRPVLLGHNAAPVIKSRQRRLLNALRSMYKERWAFPFVSVRSVQNGESVERSQRSRSFLFFSLATALADGLKLKHILCPENGVVSLNLPWSDQISTMATRTTHPKTLHLFNTLLSLLYDSAPTLTNPLVLKTKGDIAKLMVENDASDISIASVSCAKTTFRAKAVPHCGICTQCIQRRFALAYAGIGSHEAIQSYETDVFTDKLTDGEAATNADGYLRLVRSLSTIEQTSFYGKHKSALLAIDPLSNHVSDPETAIFQMMQRESTQALSVIDLKSKEHRRDLRLGMIPGRSLLGMARYGLSGDIK